MKEFRYNTELEKITMKEYGRTVQEMVNHCLTIEDREERQRCANTIIQTMARLTQENPTNPIVQTKLWNHLAIISDFKLDIDYPVQIIQKEYVMQRPRPMSTPQTQIKHRHYGHIIEQALDRLKDMEEGPERDALAGQVADRMRQSLFTWNPDVMSEEKVIRDLEHYTQSQEIVKSLEGHKFAPLQNISISILPSKRKSKKYNKI